MKKQQAIALKWNPVSEAIPKLTAKGSGFIADEIIRLAKENGIPIRQDNDLVQVFSLMKYSSLIRRNEGRRSSTA